jgi:hypothetical protein
MNEFVARSPNPIKINISDIGPLLSLNSNELGHRSSILALWGKRRFVFVYLILLCGDVHPCPGPPLLSLNPDHQIGPTLRDISGFKVAEGAYSIIMKNFLL